jgi:hypothetical protein
MMAFGISGWYLSAIYSTTRGESLLSAAAQIQPFTVSYSAAWLIARLSAQHIITIGATAMLALKILIVTCKYLHETQNQVLSPLWELTNERKPADSSAVLAQQCYWAQEFLAIYFAAFCSHCIFTAAQMIASYSAKRSREGIAGSLITFPTYGMSTGNGFGGVVEAVTNHSGQDLLRGYRGALHLGNASAAAIIVLSLMFVRIQKARGRLN